MALVLTGYDDNGDPIWEEDGTEFGSDATNLGPGVTADGGVDASGNPTYVDANGNPVTADGIPIDNANVRTALEGGGFKTVNPNGSVTYEDPDGSVYTVNPNGTYTTAGGTYDPKTGTFTDPANASGSGIGSLMNSLKSAFKKADGTYDWAKIAGVGTALYGALGGSKKTPGGYAGSIPKLTAAREQIQYNDPNRRPGAQGRQYFTDVNYSGASTAPQAQGILANYTPAAAPVSKWNAANAVATPWAKPAVAAPATPAAPVMTPEQKLASIQEPIKAATGRYLQGPTDGMADELNTSIDNKQPAKLSHGEFVVPADVVSHLGNGNSDAGARKLYAMMDKVRVARTGTKKQGKKINPDKFMPGGNVNKYAKGGIAELPVKKFAGTTGSTVSGPAADTTTTSTLSPWAGDYVTGMLGKGQALAETPYQAYTGPLTAGASDLQQQQFAGLSNVAQTGLAPTQYSTGTFGTEEANKYMNPYLKTALDPQLEELRRQSQINLQGGLGKYAKMGGYGGGRQAILESEAARNLLQEQNKTVGQGYATAYDKAAAQFNAERNRQLQTEQAQQAANEASAQFGLKSLQDLGQAGATQRAIESEGVAADKAQFEEQRDWPYKMVQYQQGLLQGLPITTQANTQNMSPLTSLLSSLGYGGQLMDLIKKYTGDTTSSGSSGTTSSTSSGTTGK